MFYNLEFMTLKLINEREYKRRFKEITRFFKMGEDNDWKVQYSLPVLRRAGQIFDVFPPKGKNKKLKAKNCYVNAIKKMSEGYDYVEGVITSKKTGFQISHAWNVDSTGNHIDFTILETQNFQYHGIILPKDIIINVCEKNGKIWYCCLPYIVAK